jgi:hypothetical protein
MTNEMKAAAMDRAGELPVQMFEPAVCGQVSDGIACRWIRRGSEKLCPDCNPRIEREQTLREIIDGATGEDMHVYVPVAALRAALDDAERYQWLRRRTPGSAYRVMGIIYSEGGASVDAAIDAAIKATS